MGVNINVCPTPCNATVAFPFRLRHLPKTRNHPPGDASLPQSPCCHQGSGAFTSSGADLASSAETWKEYTPDSQSAGTINFTELAVTWSGVNTTLFCMAA